LGARIAKSVEVRRFCRIFGGGQEVFSTFNKFTRFLLKLHRFSMLVSTGNHSVLCGAPIERMERRKAVRRTKKETS
jgi:hypothetical protein